MTYSGPERRTVPYNYEQLALLVRESTAAEMVIVAQAITDELGRVARLIEGENHQGINSGIIGSIGALTDCDAKLDLRVGLLDNRVGSLEDKWDRVRWTVAGAALGGGFGGGGIVAWIIHIAQGATP